MGAEAHETGETEPAQPVASVAGVTPVLVSLCLQGLGYVGLEGLECVSGRLVGGAAVMLVHRESAAEFIARGGRIPAPLQSLRN